jgi:multiple sugar transport system substrate-binding protein
MWGASSHISGQVLKNTITFLDFVATDPRWQVKLSTGLPAWGPDQDPWLANQKKSGYFADFPQLASAIKTAVADVRPDHSWLLYNTGAIWTQVVTPALDANQSLSSIWSTFTSTLKNTASSVGYKVK